ncbi:sialidase family protein [Spirosoma montaniterrae]|nr:sialidase family protein [Spirosoma montaniterrae]
MSLSPRFILTAFIMLTALLPTQAGTIFADSTRTFAVPTLAKTPKGTVALSWTEKDANGMVYFYWAESVDQGRTFGTKKQIFASPGMSGSRLMRPRLLFRPNGSIMAVFALRGTDVAPAQADHHNHGAAPAGEKPKQEGRAGGRPSDLQIVYTTSADGTAWTQPAPVHADRTPNTVRGFFDATILANGEVAVTYLKDIPGKPHERDLRLVRTAGGKFGDEQVLDPFVCDCCNISLLVDKAGTLHLYYRENQDNIRDIAAMRSTDNGATFSKASIFSPDNWRVNGCPHSGPTSSAGGGQNLVAWFSGATDAPGIRVADQNGRKLVVLSEATAKNPYLVPTPSASVLLWEQNQPTESTPVSTIAYRSIQGGKVTDMQVVTGSANGTNASGLAADGQLVVAYEVRQANNKNALGVSLVKL